MDKIHDGQRRDTISKLLRDIDLLLQYVKILEERRINHIIYGENDVLNEDKELEAIENQLELIKFKED